MEALIGITGKDFVLLAADTLSARSIVVMKGDGKKIVNLNDQVAMAYCGEPGDTVNFAEYIQANVRLYSMRNNLDLDPKAAAHFTRRNLADSLRSRTPYSVNMLIGGVGKKGIPELYWLDYLSALTKVPFAAHGYASYFVLSLMDRHYREGMDETEAMDLLQKCLRELAQRFIVNLPDFYVKIVKGNGQVQDMFIKVI